MKKHILVLLVSFALQYLEFKCSGQEVSGPLPRELSQRIHEGISKAYDARRQAEIDKYFKRLLTNPPPAAQVAIMSGLSNLKLTPTEATPRYMGLLGSSSSLVREQALNALASLGTSARVAVPKLTGLLLDSTCHPNVRAAAARALGAIGADEAKIPQAMARLLSDSGLPVIMRESLAVGIGGFGPLANAAQDTLIASLTDSNVRVQVAAFEALGNISESSNTFGAFSLTTEEFLNLSVLGQASYLHEVIRAGPKAGAAIPTLAALVSAANPYHAASAIEGLRSIGIETGQQVGALLTGVGSHESVISRLAISALSWVRTNDLEILPVLMSGLADPNQNVRWQAARAICKFGPCAKSATPALIKALQECSPSTFHMQVGAYLEALRAIGPDAAAAADAITALLPENSALYQGYGKIELHHLRGFILVTLADIGITESAVPYILDGLANSDPSGAYVYAAAARAAAALGPRAKDAIPHLIAGLRMADYDRPLTFRNYFAHMDLLGNYTSPAIEAARALGAIGPAAQAAAPFLQEIIAANRDEPIGFVSLGYEAALALRSIAP